jgi:hypothetical protein
MEAFVAASGRILGDLLSHSEDFFSCISDLVSHGSFPGKKWRVLREIGRRQGSSMPYCCPPTAMGRL